MRTVTEYHGGPKCLTRVRLHYRPVATTVLINLFILLVLGYRSVFLDRRDLYAWIIYGLFALWIAFRARRLKRRFADLVIAAASKSGLTRVFGAASKPAPKG